MTPGSVTATVRRLGRFDALALTALIWFLAKFLRYAFPPLFDPLAATYGASYAILGTAYSGLMLVYAAVQFPSGLLADRVGSVTVITAGALVAAAGALVLVVDAPFAVLVGAMLLVGAGTGVHKTVAVRLLARAYADRTGRALGVMDTFGAFGGVVAPAAVALFLGAPGVFGAGWRTLFLAGGVAGVALAAGFAVRVPRRLSGGTDASASGERGGLRQYVALFREWRFTAFVVATVLFSFAYNGLVAFLPTYLAQAAGLSATTASLIYSALFAASLVQLATGEASDRLGEVPVVGATLGLSTAALIALILLTPTGDPLLLGAAAVATGLGSHGFRPVRGAYLMSLVPDAIAGGSLGVVRTLLMGAGAVSPAVVGILSETVGFIPAFWLLAGSLAGATALAAALWADERRR
ncbi:MFS transporter [Halostella sp. JP-L12]|uniref:MFS transporter n=1 Tax=Halostella TaxID=1843185 RepID=UPI000EF7704B|nr:MULTISPECIES: MFS transporter [Halostella]NHN46650.1 MFS transporter [Halostella sp. JP-L12]